MMIAVEISYGDEDSSSWGWEVSLIVKCAVSVPEQDADLLPGADNQICVSVTIQICDG
jgi:hypothetical protein